MPHPKIEPWPADKPLPSLLSPRQLWAVVGGCESGFYKKQQLGLFKRFEVDQPIGEHRYSGRLVDAWRRGEPVDARVRARWSA
jgi:hypothetical protein